MGLRKGYLRSKFLLDNLEIQKDKMEKDFLASHGRNENHIWEIIEESEESEFDRLNIGFAEILEGNGIHILIDNARDELRKAENDLIAYGLSLLPEREAEILRSSRRDITIRRKMIALILKLA
jgi:hypothetical protein